jgi:uncharacterized protein
MTITHAVDAPALVDRYVAVWAESDAAVRRDLVRALWAEDGTQFTEENEYTGFEALEGRVAAAHNQFIKEGNFEFRLAGEPASHHGAVMFVTEMVPQAGGDAVWAATIVLLVDGDGLVVNDYHFGRYLQPAA